MFGISPALVWFLIGVAFLLAELALPGLILIFFCFGSWIAALVSGLFDPSVELELAVFLASSIILLFLLRKYFMRTFGGRAKGGDEPEPPAGGPALVTARITPATPGEIKYRGSFWRATADVAIDKGATVTVLGPTSPDGLTYRVKPTQGD